MRRTVSSIKEAARRGTLFTVYNKAVVSVQADFHQWVRTAHREDFVVLIRDGWEVATRAGHAAGPEPHTPEEARAFLQGIEELGEPACVALMVLWRRYSSGNRYFSPFKKEEAHD